MVFYPTAVRGHISATVPPIGVKFCMMVHISPGRCFSPFGGGTPRDPQNLKFWPSINECLENGESQSYVSVRA